MKPTLDSFSKSGKEILRNQPTFDLDPSPLKGLADLAEEDPLVLRLSAADTEAQHHHKILQEGL